MKARARDPEALTPAAARILDAAALLFYERGVTAVGVDLIAAESGVTKRTLYNQFGSKDVLVATYLLRRNRRWRAAVEREVDGATSPCARILAPFVALRSWTASNARGCAFVNALAELPDPEHPAHRVATDQKRWLLDLFRRLCAEAELPDPDQLAHRLLCLHEGALAIRPALPGTDSAGIAHETARALLSTAAAA